MGGPQPRLLLRVAHPGDPGREGRLSRRALSIDGAVVPGLLLLLARDLALRDPPRVLAWRLSHDDTLAQAARWLCALLPAPSGALDRDPVALLLSGLAVLLALGYAALAAFGGRPALRAATIGLAALVLVVLPSIAFVAMGASADRPYGQDGGIVQLPLAIDRILAGESPYGADYSNTILAKQARVSSFWEELGGNPILHHHAYLPGTHLLMLPFRLVSRAAFGFFDPRAATLVFYALVILLAARVPEPTDARLVAAGIAALNPLVYWHQIFGANDMVFVALLLGSLLLARRGCGLAAAALLGLACATKQLAWPYAPFLLLFLSGARSFRDLVAPATWRRLAGPAAAAAAVFVVVVLPVATLDFRAFWGDIVVYNVGLPGADNYPLGGTPGFGAANYLLYFGRVSSLRDYFPFSVFYVLLVPLGLLLARAQMKDGRAEWALATGSTALVASIYFSRVVHPNYLVPAAVLLPLAVLARRRGPDLALVPLLLFAAAVEIAEGAVFRSAWEQLVAAGLPARASGIVAALAPRAGPQLSKDPLGLVFSATAAGLGLLYLALAVCQAPRRARAVVLAAAVVLVVFVPTLVLVGAGERTGLVRAQDPAVVQASADAGRLAAGRSPYTSPPETTPRGREAFSLSFRLDPPAELLPDRPLLPPGPALVGLVGRVLGERDLRVPVLGALAVLAIILSLATSGRSRRALLAVALVAPPLGLGTVLGSPAALTVAALAGSWALRRRGRATAAGVLAGLAAALDHRAALAALPLLLCGKERARPGGGQRARSLVAALAAYAAAVAPVALLDAPAFVARLRAATSPGPGLGVFNLLAYRGAESSAFALGLAAVAALLSLAVALALARAALAPATAAALASLAAIALAPAVSPDAVALPLVLLALAVVEIPRESAGPQALATT